MRYCRKPVFLCYKTTKPCKVSYSEVFSGILQDESRAKDGIQLDVVAFGDWDTFTFLNDPSLAAAIKLLGHK